MINSNIADQSTMMMMMMMMLMMITIITLATCERTYSFNPTLAIGNNLGDQLTGIG